MPALERSISQGGAFQPAEDYDIAGHWHFLTTPSVRGRGPYAVPDPLATVSQITSGAAAGVAAALATWPGSATLTTIGPLVVVGTEITFFGSSFKFRGPSSNGVEIRSPKFATDNTFFGLLAGNSTGTGVDNSAFGLGVLTNLTTGNYNTGIGQGALDALTTGSNNVAAGVAALKDCATGGSNVALGFHALYVNNANSNVAVGAAALQVATASYSVAVGYQAGKVLTTGDKNTYVGTFAGGAVIAGANNVAVGYLAGGSHLGSGNVCLGYSAGALETGSNRLYIDNAPRASEADARVKALIYGVFDAAVANQRVTINGSLAVTSVGAFVASDKYLVIDAAGNIHQSALGPAS